MPVHKTTHCASEKKNKNKKNKKYNVKQKEKVR